MTCNNFGGYQFLGPHLNRDTLPKQSGVYVITYFINDFHEVIDVGESHDISNRIQNHDRMDQWAKLTGNSFYVWTMNADESQRMLAERHLRLIYDPACGDR